MTRNGVHTKQLFGTIDALTAQPTLGAFRFRAVNQWIDGAHSRTTVQPFYGAGQEDDSRAREFVLDAGAPGILLGADTGPSPVEALLHALAACLTTTVVYVAAARKVRLTEVSSTLEGELDLLGCFGLADEARNGFTLDPRAIRRRRRRAGGQAARDRRARAGSARPSTTCSPAACRCESRGRRETGAGSVAAGCPIRPATSPPSSKAWRRTWRTRCAAPRPAGWRSGWRCTCSTRSRAGAAGTRSSAPPPGRPGAAAPRRGRGLGGRRRAPAAWLRRAAATSVRVLLLRRATSRGADCTLLAGTLVAEGAGEIADGARCCWRSPPALGVAPALGAPTPWAARRAAAGDRRAGLLARRVARLRRTLAARPRLRGARLARRPTRATVLPWQCASRACRVASLACFLAAFSPAGHADRGAAGDVRAGQRPHGAVRAGVASAPASRCSPPRSGRPRGPPCRPAQLAACFVATSALLTLAGLVLTTAICLREAAPARRARRASPPVRGARPALRAAP